MNKALEKFGLVSVIWMFLACDSGQDPIIASNFKELDHNELVEILVQKKALDVLYDVNEFYDTLYFFKINNDMDLKSVLWVNPEGYNFENVNSLKINFGSDSVMFFGQMDYRPGKGDMEKEKLEKVLGYYLKFYGEPDIQLNRSYDDFKLINDVELEFEKRKVQKENTADRKFDISNSISIHDIFNIYNYKVWSLSEYKLMICDFYHKSDSTRLFGYIKYEVNDLAKVLADKREEIRRNASLDDYINMDLNLNPFSNSPMQSYTDRLNIVGSRLGHILAEESRDIKQFKFNVFIEDEYEDIILTINDLELSLDYPLEAPNNGGFSAKSGQFQWTVDYNRNSSNSRDFEKLRILRERKVELGKFDDINLRYEITAIIFDDGDVLKK